MSLLQDEGPSRECANICIMQGDDHVGQCMGNKPETTCYEEGNKGQFQNLFRKNFRKVQYFEN